MEKHRDTSDGAVPRGEMDGNLAVTHFAFNGATYDRVRNNMSLTPIAALVAAAVGSNGADQVNYNGRGLHLTIDITAITASVALAVVATTVLRVYPGLTVIANLAANDVLPREWRVITVIGGTTPAVTATIAASVIN